MVKIMKLILLITFSLVTTVFLSAQENENKTPNNDMRSIIRIGLLISPVPIKGSISGTEKGIRTDAQNYTSLLNNALISSGKGNPDYSASKENSGFCFFIEWIEFLNNNFGIGILSGTDTYKIKLNCESSYWVDEPNYELKINSIPLQPSLYYKFNITENHKILAGLGPSFNYTTYEYRFSQESDSTLTGDMQFTRKYTGISYGFHGSIEYLYCCDHFLIFSIGVKYDMLQSYNIKNTFTINNEKVNINLQTVSFLISLGIYF